MTTTTDPLVRDPATAARGRWLMLIVLLAGQFMVLTTTIQLGQAVGVATFGSLFLTLDTGRGVTAPRRPPGMRWRSR